MDKSLPNRAIEWRDKRLVLLDQRLLPAQVEFMEINSAAETYDAIKNMVVQSIFNLSQF